MQITHLFIDPAPPALPEVLAFASVYLDGELALHGLTLISLPPDPAGG